MHLKNALQKQPNDSELHFLNGQVAIKSGNYDLAKTELRTLLDDPRHGKEARVLLAQAYLATGNARLALETLNAAPLSSGTAYAIAAEADLALGRSDEALGLLAKGLAAYPQSGPLLLADAQFAIITGDVARARSRVQQALVRNPNDAPTVLLAGRMSLLDGDQANAEAYFDQVLKTDAGNPVALLAKAALAHERGDRAAAGKFLQAASNSGGSSNLVTRGFMAQMAIEAGDFDRANALVTGIPAGLSMPYFDMLRGAIAAGRGQNEQAISLLRPYFERGGDNPGARLALSSAYEQTGQLQQAWRVLKPLAAAANADAAILNMAARQTAALSLPDVQGYRARLANALQPDPAAKAMRAANAAIAKGDWPAADRTYQQLLARNPASADVILLNNAALAKLMLDDKTAAIALARRAHGLAPDDPIVQDTLGWALFKSQGATAEAIALIRTAYAAQPGNAEIRSHLAQIANTAAPRPAPRSAD